MVEDFLQGLTARGLSNENAVYVYKAFTGFLLGHLLLEVAEAAADAAPRDVPSGDGGRVPSRQKSSEYLEEALGRAAAPKARCA